MRNTVTQKSMPLTINHMNRLKIWWQSWSSLLTFLYFGGCRNKSKWTPLSEIFQTQCQTSSEIRYGKIWNNHFPVFIFLLYLYWMLLILEGNSSYIHYFLSLRFNGPILIQAVLPCNAAHWDLGSFVLFPGLPQHFLHPSTETLLCLLPTFSVSGSLYLSTFCLDLVYVTFTVAFGRWESLLWGLGRCLSG